jgi:hypothetical protein
MKPEPRKLDSPTQVDWIEVVPPLEEVAARAAFESWLDASPGRRDRVGRDDILADLILGNPGDACLWRYRVRAARAK